MLAASCWALIACGGSPTNKAPTATLAAVSPTAIASPEPTPGLPSPGSAGAADHNGAPNRPVTTASLALEAAEQTASDLLQAPMVGTGTCNPGPPAVDCISDHPFATSADRGVAVMDLAAAPPADGGAILIMGRKGDGHWDLWFITQNNYYQATFLPAQMRVCADNQGANLRQNPDAASKSLVLIKDGTIVTGESFVLTQPGSRQPAVRGIGWYEISAPQKGFIRSDLLSDTIWPDCTARNLSVNGHP